MSALSIVVCWCKKHYPQHQYVIIDDSDEYATVLLCYRYDAERRIVSYIAMDKQFNVHTCDIINFMGDRLYVK